MIDYADFLLPEFWLGLNPKLHISDLPFHGPASEITLASALLEREATAQRRKGYAVFNSVFDRETVDSLANAVDVLEAQGIPTPFLFAYDEVWQLFTSMRPLIEGLVGADYRVGGDGWVWKVGIGEGQQGWAAHRDDQFTQTVEADGRPQLVSLWVALSDADAENGCMYLLPSDVDPNVGASPPVYEVAAAQLSSVRALPVPAGSVLSWTTDVLHWGSRSTDRATTPRISLCLYAQRGDVPRFNDDMLTLDSPLPLHFRIGFVCRALRRYRNSNLHPGLKLSSELDRFAEEQEEAVGRWLALMRQMGGETE